MMINIDNTVVIYGCSSEVQSFDIESFCKEAGSVKQVRLMEEYAFVEFSNESEAKKAVEGLDARDFMGEEIRVFQPVGGYRKTLLQINEEESESGILEETMGILKRLSHSQQEKVMERLELSCRKKTTRPTVMHAPAETSFYTYRGYEEDEPPPNMTMPLPLPAYSPHNVKISSFSGTMPGKNEVGFQRWSYEVKCLMNSKYPNHAVLQAIRQSLKGTPADVLTWLGENATIPEILSKLEGLYGNVLTGEALVQKFYTEKMKPDESITEWGCRLENILSLAVESRAIDKGAMDSMLRTKFWMDLPEAIKTATRHKYDSLDSFGQLLVEVRAVEQEFADHQKTQKSAKAHHISASKEPGSDGKDLIQMIKALSAKVEKLERNQGECRSDRTNPQKLATHPVGAVAQKTDSEVLCYKCGHYGHVSVGCRINPKDYQPIPEHLRAEGKKQLNFQSPALRGKKQVGKWDAP